MEHASGGLPIREGLAVAAGLVPQPQPQLSWEQLLDLPLAAGAEPPAGLAAASGGNHPGAAAWPAAADPAGSVFLATQAQPTSPAFEGVLPATQAAASPLLQQLQTLQQLEQMQQEQVVRQALHITQQPELLLLQTQLQDDELPLADLLRAGLPESPERSQQAQQRSEQPQMPQQEALAPSAGALQQQAESEQREQQPEPSPSQQQRQAQRELRPLGLPPLHRGASYDSQQHEPQPARSPAEQPISPGQEPGREQEQEEQQVQQQVQQQQQQTGEQQQQQPEQAAGQPEQAPRQGSADENEQPPADNRQEQPHARRRSARAAKRPALTEADGAAAEDALAAAAPDGKRRRAGGRPRPRQQPHRAARAQHPMAEASEEEVPVEEAGGGEEAAQLLQRPLLQEAPTPLEGVDCGLPPAPPRWEGHAPEPLTQQALAALAKQDAASHDQHLRLLRFDDRMAELASQSGLLVRFHVRTIRSYQAQAEVVVEAPEFMTVEYLKRRVARAKLQRGELLPTTRFVLRKKVHGLQAANEDGTAAGPGPAGVGLEDLPSCTPAGDEVFLADLGYGAPGPYELCIASAPQTSDREQQESMLADLMVQAQAHQRQRQAAAAAAAAASRAAQPPELQNAALSYRALLHAAPSAEDGGSGRSPSRRRRRPRASSGDGHPPGANGAAQDAAAAAAAAAAAGGNHSMGVSAAGSRLSLSGEGERSRRQAGRWSAEEVAALIEGVQAHGTRWAQVYDAYVRKGRIGQQRTQVDLKDKWRNLVRLVTEPGKQARSIDLTEEQRQAILDVVFAKQAAATPGSAQRATPNGAADRGQADGGSRRSGQAAGSNGHASGSQSAGERQRQPAGSSGSGRVEQGGAAQEPPPIPQRQRNKRQRRKQPAQAAADEER